MRHTGTFEITMTAEPPFDTVEGVPLARATFDKRFSGDLVGTSRVFMTSARTPVANSAGYVAVERITGTLGDREGSFVVLHTGLMDQGTRSLAITIVPDSGTGGFAGLRGTMDIQVVDGKHTYALDLA